MHSQKELYLVLAFIFLMILMGVALLAFGFQFGRYIAIVSIFLFAFVTLIGALKALSNESDQNRD